MLSIIAFSSKTAGKCSKSCVLLCFMSTNCDSAGVVTAIFQEVPQERADVCVCVLCVQEFHLAVGGMVAQWLVLLPPKSFHVSPKFLRQAHQVTREQMSHNMKYW